MHNGSTVYQDALRPVLSAPGPVLRIVAVPSLVRLGLEVWVGMLILWAPPNLAHDLLPEHGLSKTDRLKDPMNPACSASAISR